MFISVIKYYRFNYSDTQLHQERKGAGAAVWAISSHKCGEDTGVGA